MHSSAGFKEYSELQLLRAVITGSGLIQEAGDFRTAAAVYRATWTTVFGCHLPDPEKLGSLEELIPADIFAYMRHTVQHGVHTEYEGPRSRTPCKPHGSLNQHMFECFESTWKDVQAGRVLLGSDRCDLSGVVSLMETLSCI